MTIITKKRVVFLGLILLSSLSIFYLYRYSRPKQISLDAVPAIPPTRLTPQRTDLPQVGGVKFSPSLKFPKIPDSLPVYQGEASPGNILNFSQKFISSLKLTPYSKIPNTWTNSDNSAFLTLDLSHKTVTYKVNGGKNPAAYFGLIIPKQNQALEVAAKFVSSLNLGTTYVPQPQNISYFKVVNSEFTSSSSSDYNLIEIPFAQSVNDFPLLFGTNFIFPVQILIGNNYTIVRAIVTSQPITFSQTSSQDHNTISESQVKILISKGQFQIIDAFSPQPIPVLPSQIPDITIDKVEIQYRLNDKEGLIIPYFVLTDSTSKINVTILVPAVSLD